ncbi:MAG TPA: hypothetical protein ENJ84_10165 [Gammaproteobacteria bacterium]|nr:hypothetical protein [Gammaproteobacteria bacterium]
MLGFFKKSNEPAPRSLTQPSELEVGDIIQLKERRSLPDELQGKELEVTQVGTYQYASSVEKSCTLRSADNEVYYLSIDDNDGDPVLYFSVKIPRAAVLEIFDEDDFSELWGEDYVGMKVQHRPARYAAWLTDEYHQEIKEAEAYFYHRDCADQPPSDYVDDDSDELRYHECEGLPDERFSCSVEIWGDGSTDVFLQVANPMDVIADMWPHGDG